MPPELPRRDAPYPRAGRLPPRWAAMAGDLVLGAKHRAGTSTPAQEGWVPAGVCVSVAGLALPGGMLYVGARTAGMLANPSLISASLRVDFGRPDSAASTVNYWPSYSGIGAGARAAYLTWLAGGRRDPRAPISWVFLFFYGLEHRVLVNTRAPRPERGELILLGGEVARLLVLYGNNHSFRTYARRFLELIDFYANNSDAAGWAGGPPGVGPERWATPMRLRLGLGKFAAERAPVPADWALAWAHHRADITLRTPATRCPDEFETLFRTRYNARYGAGLLVGASRAKLYLTYQPASYGLSLVAAPTGLPDVINQAGVGKKLAALVEDCTNSLDGYSRYIGRNPNAAGTLAAATLLPSELTEPAAGELGALHKFLDTTLGEQNRTLINAADLLAHWPVKTPDKPTKADAVGLASLLGAHGVGMEPDVRVGGPALTSGGLVVLFRTAPGQPGPPSAGYSAAADLLHLAAAVSCSDGDATEGETAHLRAHLQAALHLSGPERARLHAHLMWLLCGQAKLTGLTRRLSALDETQRNAIGDFLVTVAAVDGAVSPAEIATLTKIFKLLRLSDGEVFSRVHAEATGGLRSAPPVVVRSQTRGAGGHTIPARPTSVEDGAGHAPPAAGQVVRLDAAGLAVKLAETAAVSALLHSIFTDDEVEAADGGPTDGGPSACGLDGPHTALLIVLAGRPSWTRAELEAECGALRLLPDGALDTLNEAAYERVGDPVADGDGPITINADVAQEMQT